MATAALMQLTMQRVFETRKDNGERHMSKVPTWVRRLLNSTRLVWPFSLKASRQSNYRSIAGYWAGNLKEVDTVSFPADADAGHLVWQYNDCMAGFQ